MAKYAASQCCTKWTKSLKNSYLLSQLMKSDGKSGGLYTQAASSGFQRLLSGFYWGSIGFSLGNIEPVVGETEPVRARRSPCREPLGARSSLSPENASPSASEPVGEENEDHGLGSRGLAGSRAPRSLPRTRRNCRVGVNSRISFEIASCGCSGNSILGNSVRPQMRSVWPRT